MYSLGKFSWYFQGKQSRKFSFTMHIFFAYTTNTYAFKSVVFLRHWGTEIFLHDKKCTSVLSRLFKETRPIKWKSTVHQFINENGKLHKKNIRFEQKKIYCRSTYFCQLLKSPVRTEAGGTQKHVLAPGTLGWRTLTVLPQAVACSGEAWFFACMLPAFPLGFSISLLVSSSVPYPTCHFCLDVYFFTCNPPVSIYCCN